ncbi:hypothetical protein DTO013E5_7438 [Penicillium roqueforti]|nr:hypothetical protein DTO013F2_9524 [Penicillium roqueforti]KAI2743290.1 hypothetical protein DTO012A1_3204 [Penicillium roqueforti]KAI2767559.1 hypothetical protein DTO012A8_7231 [Penicillium roqueforti]KAI3070434.1 hypothetical protein CBS147339_7396 [Penicillium roqueforti]KAI3095004.1 hypothetical protein CBS147338_6070 [Penicillium roqueforti]
MSCNFDCSAPTPLSPNSDITGIGIIINNIVTTGIAVVIISIYHFTAYDPIHDLSHDGQTPFRPNPVDVSSLALFKSYLSPFVKIARSKRFANVLIKCIRAMSDMQIMTGFFLLISGYSQLKCGLATYHWLVVVDQAWLSCLVQLSCLTHLRSYFHNRPIERTLRLLAAGVSTIMLIVGLSFTGNYDWAFNADSSDPDHPTISDPAICYMRARPAMNSAFFSMPFSIILIIFGFASRVINLYAIYLTGSVFVDVWDSAAIEVVWLIIAFAFGITRVIGIIHRPEKMGLDASLTSFNDWSFGQVGAMVVLAAPLITLIGLFYEEDETRVQDEEPLSDSQTAPPPELPAPSISNVITDLNDPFKDWISHSQIFYLVDGHIFTMLISVFFWMAERDPFGKIKKTLLEDILVSSGIKMVVPILFSLMVETIFAEAGPTSISYNLAQVVVKLHSLSCLTFFSVSSSTKITYCLLPILVIWALAHRFYPFFQALFSSKLLAFLRLS